MRIGHQIYNYLYEHLDSGRVNIVSPIKITSVDNLVKGHIYECHIHWLENQVYIGVVTPEGDKLALSVNGFLKWMDGPTKPQSYKPLYELRDKLKALTKRETNNIIHYENTRTRC